MFSNENGLIVVNKNKLIAEEIAEQVADIILARASGREQTADIWNGKMYGFGFMRRS